MGKSESITQRTLKELKALYISLYFAFSSLINDENTIEFMIH